MQFKVFARKAKNSLIFNKRIMFIFYLLHLSLQYFTASQTLAHFFRQVNGLPQVAQIFCGRFSFLMFFKM
jgi:hypothetical protein